MLQHSLLMSLMGYYSLVAIYTLYNQSRSATLFAFIPFWFGVGYYFAFDFNIDFVEDGSGNMKDMPSIVNWFDKLQTYIISTGLLNAGLFVFSTKYLADDYNAWDIFSLEASFLCGTFLFITALANLVIDNL